jgi:hypothetical protein
MLLLLSANSVASVQQPQQQSPPSERKGFLGTLSPRGSSKKGDKKVVANDKKSDKEKKGWSKSLERKRANELTAQKKKQLSNPDMSVALEDSTSGILKALDESDSAADSSDVSITPLTKGSNNNNNN